MSGEFLLPQEVVAFDHPDDRTAKVACSICGRTGWGPRTENAALIRAHLYPWQAKCLDSGHPHRCKCGRRFGSLSGLSAHIYPRHAKTDAERRAHEEAHA